MGSRPGPSFTLLGRSVVRRSREQRRWSTGGRMVLTGGASVRLAETATTILTQPITLCGLECAYCYRGDGAAHRRMPLVVADAVCGHRHGVVAIHPVWVLWHGVKPVAPGLGHCWAGRRFGRGDGHPGVQSIQTYGTLIDDVWCELFACRPVQVVVSLDGAGAGADNPVTARPGRSSDHRANAARAGSCGPWRAFQCPRARWHGNVLRASRTIEDF
jgi:sulfatase maturation enzyme AslB (radical SAM superfamily)